jgi:hypothetical protein
MKELAVKAAIGTLRKHLTYANVGVTICLLAVLGSASAVAAARWGSSDIIDNSLRSRDIRTNEVASSDIRNGTISSTDLSSSTRSSLTDTSPWETIPSGVTVRGGFYEDYPVVNASETHVTNIQLPALPPTAFAMENVNFSVDAHPTTIDDDAGCTGTAANPTAPPGQVCLYLVAAGGVTDIEGRGWSIEDYRSMGLFYIRWVDSPTAALGDNVSLYGTWAYTAP